MSVPVLHRAIHVNRLVAADRGLGPRSARARVGAWDLTDAGEPDFTVANGAAVVGAAREADLPAALAWFADRAIAPAFELRSDVDAHLVSALEQRGFRRSEAMPAMVLRSYVARPRVGALHVCEVTDPAAVDRYGAVNWPAPLDRIGRGIAATAARLGFTLLLGELEGEPVACSMAVVTDRVVGIYNVAVESPFRRRGYGEAMTAAAIEAGRRRGAEVAWLGASAMGLPLYERMGFETVFEYVRMTPA